MKVSGKLVEIFDTVKIKDSFQKREFVIEYATNPKYPELIKFELVQDKCAQLDKFKVGQAIAVDFDLRGRKWTDPKGTVKYFTTLQAWRLGEDNQETGAAGDSGGPPLEDTEDYDGPGKDENLPF
jgi:hypothetical protein